MFFRKWGCLVGPENSIFRKLKSVDRKKMPLTTKIILHFYFPFKIFPENERERERERAHARGEAINGAISRSVDRDLGSSSLAVDRDFFLGCGVCFFLDLCFPSSFPNTRKYFPENFLKCNQTRGNIFLFRKLAFPENMYFPENVLQQPNTA